MLLLCLCACSLALCFVLWFDSERKMARKEGKYNNTGTGTISFPWIAWQHPYIPWAHSLRNSLIV